MGWSYRKSFGSGPFRVNFSKSGISYSVGVKGARVNVGPRGTFVHLSSHGISYRKKIGTAPVSSRQQANLPRAFEPGHHIASAAVEQLTDSDSKAFIDELTQKSGQTSYVGLFGTFPLILFLSILAFTTFSTKTRVAQPQTDSALVYVTSDIGANVRAKADPKSPIVKTALGGQAFLPADSTNSKWLNLRIISIVVCPNPPCASLRGYRRPSGAGQSLRSMHPDRWMDRFYIWFRWLIKFDKRRFERNG